MNKMYDGVVAILLILLNNYYHYIKLKTMLDQETWVFVSLAVSKL